jgi:hypothetical protein
MRSFRLFGVIAIGAVLLLAACGDSDDDNPEPTATSAPAPTSTIEPSASVAPGDLQTTVAMATEIAGYQGELNACSLVSRAKAEEIMGEQLSGDPWTGASGLPNLESYCNYNPSDVPGQNIVEGKTVTLIALSKADLAMFDPSIADVKTAFDRAREDAKDEPGYLDVSGLGDEAYYTSDSGLNVLAGDYGLTVSGLSLDKDKQFMQVALDSL